MNLPSSNNLNITPNNIMPQYLNLQQNQQNLNFSNLQNIHIPQLLPNLNVQNFSNLNNMQNFSNLNPPIPNKNMIQDLNLQKILNDNNNLIQNLASFINLKKQLNQNQLHLNQNQIYFNQNHVYLNNHNLPNTQNNLNTISSNKINHFVPNNLNLLKDLSNILNQNNINNLNLNQANFNSAYKIEKRDKDDIQFNLLNENGRKIIIKNEVIFKYFC